MTSKQRSFRQDIRRKFIFFGLGPMLLIGIVAALLIYQAEESLIVSEHTRLLRTIEKLSSDQYRRIHLLFNVIKNKITQDDIRAIKEGFDLAPDLQSVIVLNHQGEIEQLYCPHHCQIGTFKLDPDQKALVSEIIQGHSTQKGRVYYSKENNATLLSHAFAHKEKIYLINADTRSFFNKISYYIQKKAERSISIINQQGVYIYDSMHPYYVEERRRFTEEGAYTAAVKDHDPYTVTEYPQHYQTGDSFWKGLLDEDNFLSYARITDFDWIVTVRDHADTIDTYLQQVIIFAFLLMVLTMVLTIVSANMISQYIIVPVERLIRDINTFAQGIHSGENLVSIATYPIFKDLLKSFQTMQKKILAREQKLKEQIQENIKMRDQLIHQEKMAAMGEMIGNIAHQWRQPLSVISTLSTGLKTEQEIGIIDEKSILQTCTQINDNAQYLSKTIDDFRQFIKGEHQKRDFKASLLLESLQNLLQGQFKNHHITLDTAIDSSLVIHGYRNDLLQVLINLLGNAKDALVENQAENRYIHLEIYKDTKSQVVLCVTDNGGGIAEKDIKHIFEPYFTTKHKSHGTGLGLHMVHRLIIEGMGGEITVKNISFVYQDREYQGAQFTVILPNA